MQLLFVGFPMTALCIDCIVRVDVEHGMVGTIPQEAALDTDLW